MRESLSGDYVIAEKGIGGMPTETRWSRLVAWALVVFTLVGCGGRNPNPVVRYQPGDEKRSCEGLKAEIAHNEAEIIKLLPYEDATGKNVALGVTGFFLVVPLFFMDFKDAEEMEIKAYRDRNLWLREVAANEDCNVPPSNIQFQDEPPEPADDDEHVKRAKEVT